MANTQEVNVVAVPPDRIRSIYDESQYPMLIADGQLLAKLKYNKHLEEHRPPSEPECTRSQIIQYFDAAEQLRVVVHQYFRPNQTLGGSGRPDPKRVRIGDTVFILDPHS